MFITYVSNWLYTVMQLPVPIVLSPNHIYSISIWNLFIGVLLLGVFMILIERAFNGLTLSDFRIKEHAPETVEISRSSTNLNSYDNIGRRRFPGNSSRNKKTIGQRLIKYKSKNKINDNRNIGVRLSEKKVNERNKTYESLIDYKMKKSMERNEK